MAQTESEVVQGIGSDYEVKYGFNVPEDYFFKSGRGLSHELVDAISSHKNEPDWMRKFRHKSLDYFLARPMPTWGGQPSLGEIDFDNIYYYIKPTENQADSWEDLPADIKDTWDKLGHSRGREEVPRRGRCAVRERGRLPQAAGAPDRAGRHLPRHRHGAPRARGHLQAVLRDDHPAERQQVRGAEQRRLVGRLVHLRAARRPDRAAAPGLLPHQRGEHGPVRAHADHRRRGRVRALRRGLHRTDLLDATRCTAPSSRSSSRRAAVAATRRSRTGRPTSTTSSRSARSPRRTRRWSGSTATSARS